MLGKGIALGKNKEFTIKSWVINILIKNHFHTVIKLTSILLRKGRVVGEHEVKFSSGKEIVTLSHESFDGAFYSEGAL